MSGAGFETLDLRASGQVAQQVKAYKDVMSLTLAAWQSLERSIFQAAWLVCGFFPQEHFAMFDSNLDLAEMGEDRCKEKLQDAFTVCGKGPWSPQRCTCYEWQLQDDAGSELKAVFEVSGITNIAM